MRHLKLPKCSFIKLPQLPNAKCGLNQNEIIIQKTQSCMQIQIISTGLSKLGKLDLIPFKHQSLINTAHYYQPPALHSVHTHFRTQYWSLSTQSSTPLVLLQTSCKCVTKRMKLHGAMRFSTNRVAESSCSNAGCTFRLLCLQRLLLTETTLSQKQ